jgi:hypothetical protein
MAVNAHGKCAAVDVPSHPPSPFGLWRVKAGYGRNVHTSFNAADRSGVWRFLQKSAKETKVYLRELRCLVFKCAPNPMVFFGNQSQSVTLNAGFLFSLVFSLPILPGNGSFEL